MKESIIVQEKIKKYIDIWPVAILLFLKPLSDMWYQNRVIDVVLVLYAAVLWIVFRKHFRLSKHLIIVSSGLAYFAVRCLLDGSTAGVLSGFKLASAILMLWLAMEMDTNKTSSMLDVVKVSYLIVIAVNYLYYFMGWGFQYWGSQNQTDSYTFTGPYYFKTDLAIAMIQAIIVILYAERVHIWDGIWVLLASWMIIISNSRIMFAALIAVLLFFALRCYAVKKNGELFQRTDRFVIIKMFVLCILFVVLAVGIQKGVSELSVFKDQNYYSFADAEELTSMDYGNEEGATVEDVIRYNTNFRSVIWKEHLQYMWDNGIVCRLFGHGKNLEGATWTSQDAHGLYVWVLSAGGLIGAVVFLIGLLTVVMRISRIQNVKQFYMALAFFVVFALIGISYTTLENTQTTWISFFFMTLACKGAQKEFS